MGCGCSGVPSGYVRRWQFIRSGQRTVEYDTQPDAITAQRAAGGAGRIQTVTKKVTRAQ